MILKEVKCQCGKKYKIAENERVCGCPYCDSIGLLFDSTQYLFYKSKDTMYDFERAIVRAIWLDLFNYNWPKL